VISGYGIAAALSRNISPLVFLWARIKRIYPVYWWHLLFAALIIPAVSAIVSLLKSHPFSPDFFRYSFPEWLHIVALTKVFLAQDWRLNLAFLPLNGVIWYIAVIVQIYIVVTLCMSMKWRNTALFILFIASIASVIPGIKVYIPYGLFMPYFPLVYIGMTIHEFLMHKQPVPLMATIALSIAVCFFSSYIDVQYIVASLVSGLIFLALYRFDDVLSRLPALRSLSWIGGFSYSLYLMHVPLWPFVNMFIRNLVPIPDVISGPLILVPGIICLTYLWHLLFERRRWGQFKAGIIVWKQH